jgi:hypothetical protein
MIYLRLVDGKKDYGHVLVYDYMRSNTVLACIWDIGKDYK